MNKRLENMSLPQLIKLSKIIETFKRSQDYIDINYMINHVKDINVRLNVLNSMGYRLGLNAVTENITEKTIFIGKRNEIRYIVTPKYDKANYAMCVIIDNNKIYFQ